MDVRNHKTKLHLPAVPPKTYYSERLRNLGIEKNRLSVLLAPSGFGKTTAVLLSLQSFRDRTIWYRLDAEDQFLTVFYHRLISMLFSKDPLVMEEQWNLLHSLNQLEEESSILNAQICQDMHYLHGQDERPLYLVFDDFQWLADRESVKDSLQYFVRNMPSCVRIIVTSRTDPILFSGNLCLNRQCRQYTAKDLLFRPQEVQNLIEEIYRFSFSPQQLCFIEERAQGWAAGIYLLSHTLQSRPALQGPNRPSKELDDLFSHFFREYLLAMETDKMDRLMELALLDDFSVNELMNLFHQDHPHEFLHWLEVNQLCFQTMADGTTRYFFHSLLSDELKRLYKDRHSHSEQQQMYLRIAVYYEPIDLEKSLFYYLQAQQTSKAVALAASYAAKCFNDGKPAAFISVLLLFTEEQIAENPYLMLMEGMRVLNQDRFKAQNCFQRAFEGFRLIKDYPFLMNCLGMLLVVAYQLNDFEALEDSSKRIPATSVFLKGGSARIHLIISYFISLIGRDKLKEAASLRKYLDKKRIHEPMWQFSYWMIRGIYLYRKGDLNGSRRNMERILTHPVIRSDDQWRTIGLVSCCNLAFLQADTVQIQYFVGEFTTLAERLQSDFSLGYAHYLRGFLHCIQGNSQDAVRSMRLAMDAFHSFGSDPITLETECYTFLMSDSVQNKDILRAKAIYEEMKCMSPGHGMEEFALGVYGILLKRASRFDEAEQALLQSFQMSEKKGALQSMYSLHLQLADLYIQKNDSAKAQYHFQQWVYIGKTHGYRYGRKFTHGALRNIAESLTEPWDDCSYCQGIDRFYQQAKRKTRRHQTVSISLLGPFSVKTDTVELTEKSFRTRKVSGLLKYILARKTPQTREYLSSVFWPESDRKSAGTSLRVALYELRKTLAKWELGFDSDHALLQEENDGFSLCADAIVAIDTEKLSELYKRWQTQSNKEDIDLLIEICALYKGHFLEKGEYDDWVTIRREHYAGIYYEALHALGSIASQRGYVPAVEYILFGLELDPLDEISYAHLIALYEKDGQRERADSVRRQFKKRFKREMGFESNI